MNYLFYGTDSHGIKEEIDKILKKINSLNVSKYDLEEDLISDVLNDAMTISMFDKNKVIVCENANMFSAAAKAESDLEEYLQNPNPDTTLIFVLNNEKLDERKKCVKSIRKNGKVLEFNKPNPNTLAKRLLEGYNISYSDTALLIDRVGTNLDNLESEINKIILYKKDNKNITKEDIINLTHKHQNTDVFKFIEYIVTNNKKEALNMYYELVKRGEEPLKLIIMLSSQFRIIYQSKTLRKRGFSEKDIAGILKIHPYRVKLALQNSSKYSSGTLLSYINDFADMDYGIKSGVLNKNNALELFILEK